LNQYDIKFKFEVFILIKTDTRHST